MREVAEVARKSQGQRIDLLVGIVGAHVETTLALVDVLAPQATPIIDNLRALLAALDAVVDKTVPLPGTEQGVNHADRSEHGGSELGVSHAERAAEVR